MEKSRRKIWKSATVVLRGFVIGFKIVVIGGSVIQFMSLEKNGPFLVGIKIWQFLSKRSIFMTITKEAITTDYFPERHQQCSGCLFPVERVL